MAEKQPVSQGGQVARKSLKEIQIPNSVAIVILVVAVAIGGIIFWFVNSGGPKEAVPAGTQFASSATANADVVEVLPQTTRGFNAAAAKNPFGEERLGEVRVTGIISNSLGKSTTILEIDGSSFIVSEGEQLPQSEWSVSHVTSTSVTFALEGSEKTIYIETPNVDPNSASGEDGDFAREAEEEELKEPEDPEISSSSSLVSSSSSSSSVAETLSSAEGNP